MMERGLYPACRHASGRGGGIGEGVGICWSYLRERTPPRRQLSREVCDSSPVLSGGAFAPGAPVHLCEPRPNDPQPAIVERCQFCCCDQRLGRHPSGLWGGRPGSVA